ncbi:hypothetical protein K2X85_15250 [bacterium]|nr:hypothetical protein [bacterium]
MGKKSTWDMTVYCSHPDYRRSPARYKIAAAWTGGDYSELKTYGFADDDCVLDVFRAAAARLTRFRSCEGETVGELRIYRLDTERSDLKLEPAIDVERRVQERLHLLTDKVG